MFVFRVLSACLAMAAVGLGLPHDHVHHQHALVHPTCAATASDWHCAGDQHDECNCQSCSGCGQEPSCDCTGDCTCGQDLPCACSDCVGSCKAPLSSKAGWNCDCVGDCDCGSNCGSTGEWHGHVITKPCAASCTAEPTCHTEAPACHTEAPACHTEAPACHTEAPACPSAPVPCPKEVPTCH